MRYVPPPNEQQISPAVHFRPMKIIPAMYIESATAINSIFPREEIEFSIPTHQNLSRFYSPLKEYTENSIEFFKNNLFILSEVSGSFEFSSLRRKKQEPPAFFITNGDTQNFSTIAAYFSSLLQHQKNPFEKILYMMIHGLSLSLFIEEEMQWTIPLSACKYQINQLDDKIWMSWSLERWGLADGKTQLPPEKSWRLVCHVTDDLIKQCSIRVDGADTRFATTIQSTRDLFDWIRKIAEQSAFSTKCQIAICGDFYKDVNHVSLFQSEY